MTGPDKAQSLQKYLFCTCDSVMWAFLLCSYLEGSPSRSLGHFPQLLAPRLTLVIPAAVSGEVSGCARVGAACRRLPVEPSVKERDTRPLKGRAWICWTWQKCEQHLSSPSCSGCTADTFLSGQICLIGSLVPKEAFMGELIL